MNKPTTPQELSNSAAFEEKITVLNPVGYPQKVNKKTLAPRPESLDGKTVYLVDCRFDDSVELLKQMQAWFAEHMPAVKTKMISLSATYQHDDPKTWEADQARWRCRDHRRRPLLNLRAGRSPRTRSRSKPSTGCRQWRCTPTSSTAWCNR